MWPFKRRTAQQKTDTPSETSPPPVAPEPQPVSGPSRWPRLAAPDTYGRFLTEEVGLTLMIGTFNHAVMHPHGDTAVRVPAITLSVPPGSGFDFAHPEYGFGGWIDPPAERVLRLWADDLLTISHGDVWRFVVAGEEPFDREWVETMFPPAPSGDDFIPERALVVVQFGDARQGEFALTELETSPMTLTYLEDLRTEP